MSLLSPQLQAFLKVAEQKTVHGAADKLFLTQTAVTQRIRTLETSLGTTLFIRTRRGMALTSEGGALLRYCLAAQDLEGEAMASISGAAKKTVLRVVVTGPGSIMRSRVIKQCLPVMKKYRNLVLRFDLRDTEDRDQLVKTGAAQFAIVRPESVAKEVKHKLLLPEKYVLVAPYTWRKRDLNDIIQTERIVDFNPEDQTTFNYLKKYNLFHLVKEDRHFVNANESILTLIKSGVGYGVLTQEFSREYIARKDIVVLNDGQIFEEDMALIWYPRSEPPDYFKDLITAIG